jgi:hypothetical protein
MRKTVTNDRVTRWLLLLQEFEITILDKHGKYNVLADFLSRITNNSDVTLVDDSFLDEYLFVVYTHSPWYEYISNYIAVGKFPHHLSPRERRKTIQESALFSCIDGCLF